MGSMGKNKKIAFEFIKEKLKGIPWAVFGGTAAEIYTNGKRSGKDIDIIVPGEFIKKVGERLGEEPILETRKKGEVKIINDYYIKTKIKGTAVEIVGKTDKFIVRGKEYRSTENLKEKLFPKIETRNYLGLKISVIPVEEFLAQKLIFNRRKDEEDIKLILKTEKVDKNKLKNSLDRWGVSKQEQNQLIKNL